MVGELQHEIALPTEEVDFTRITKSLNLSPAKFEARDNSHCSTPESLAISERPLCRPTGTEP